MWLFWRKLFPDNLPEIFVDFLEGMPMSIVQGALYIWDDLSVPIELLYAPIRRDR